ncbi:hypothetical protein Pcinc_005701 [Petrolisthes cinctipes]|uniref:Uncharacterized protein n=1 Tax=Petrolisthes cinctipes TaxID=88211 RepID=A0AAE1KZ02_PETCI|nr:hypothetical protein Pcinc_005701 [Petrolisthes cinctipes]
MYSLCVCDESVSGDFCPCLDSGKAARYTLPRPQPGAHCQEEEQRRQQEAATRQQEFATLIAALQPLNIPATPAASVQNSSSRTTGTASLQTPNSYIKAVTSPPPLLQPDTSYQAFREWRRRWQDYAVMTNLTTLPLSKMHIQLRTRLSPEVMHTLHYRIQIPQDDTLPIEDVLITLDKHFKAQTNKALRKRELFSCHQQAHATIVVILMARLTAQPLIGHVATVARRDTEQERRGALQTTEHATIVVNRAILASVPLHHGREQVNSAYHQG